jgi:enamine deaminase RidA (YjgF/YER057c/UK114 family)
MQRARSGSTFETMASYARAARVRDVVAVSGTAALDDNGVALFPGDPAAQTREALLRALSAAEELGAARTDVIRTRILLVQGVEWRGAVEAHGEIFRGVDPANTTLFVAGMIPEGCLVEVELDAVVDLDNQVAP